MSNRIEISDELLIQQDSQKFVGKVLKVNDTKQEVLIQRSFDGNVTVTNWVPFSHIVGIKKH